MTTKQLFDIAVSFRRAIVDARDERAFSFRDRMSRFPNGCCDDTADLFAHFLYHKYGIVSTRIDGTHYDDNPDNNCSHSWQEIDGLIIDLTGSQFRYDTVYINYDKDVYIGPMDAFHKLFEKTNIKQYKGIEDLNSDCWDRMFKLYDTIICFLEKQSNKSDKSL